VADLYAGTGSIGLDALSRGAEWVDFVESNRRLCGDLMERLRSWSMESRARVYRGNVLNLLRSLPGGYDLVVADPPYSSAELVGVMERLQSAGLVNPGGLIVLEHRSGSTGEFATGRFELETTKRYGDTALTVLSAGDADG
jgi:16S rRNA (guanine966-N2)-methyltransferase